MNQKVKRLLKAFIWLLLFSGMLVTIAFTSSRQNNLVCESIVVDMVDNGNYFLETADILNLINQKSEQPLGKPLQSINTAVLENCINANPYVKNAEIFLAIDGSLHITVTQCNPVVRFIMNDGTSFYADENGVQIPLSDKFTPDVVVANGYIDPVPSDMIFSEIEFVDGDTANQNLVPEQVYALAMFLKRDTIWDCLIEQIYVTENHEIELIPRLGYHIIQLGDAGNLDSKFEKLMTFYQKGLNKKGWTNYSNINLKFENQVVAVKNHKGAEVRKPEKDARTDSSKVASSILNNQTHQTNLRN